MSQQYGVYGGVSQKSDSSRTSLGRRRSRLESTSGSSSPPVTASQHFTSLYRLLPSISVLSARLTEQERLSAFKLFQVQLSALTAGCNGQLLTLLGD